MTDPNLLFSSDLSLNLLSKSSPSQLQPFQYKRSRTQPASAETPYPQKMTTIAANNSTTNSNSNLKPSNLSHVPCKFYKQGTCTAGANCTFSHSSDLSSESAVCKYFVKGNCKFGTKCALLHTMSPFGTTNTTAASTNKINGSNSNRLMMASTPPQPSLLAFTGRRKTTDQVTIPLSSSIHNPSHPDHRSFSNDPFGSSAPAVSLFHHHYQQLSEQQQQQNVWRNPQSPRTNMSTDDFIGLHSSPRESSDYLLGTSPFANYRLYSSVKSNNSGFFNNTTTDYRRQSSFANNTPTTAATVGSYSTIFDDNHTSSFFSHQQSQQQQEQGYDLNDAMLPSSLNDLFTPTELQLRKVRQQEQQYSLSYSPSGNKHSNLSGRISRDATQLSSPDRASKQNQTWRVPFLTKSTQNSSDMLMTLPADYEDKLIEGTAAINIPSNNKSNTLGNTSSSAGSSGGSQHSYLLPQQKKQQGHPQQQLKDDSLQPQDDEVQFYMEDDEAVIMYDSANDHKALNNMTSGNTVNNTSASSSTTNNYSFPSLVNLPSM